MKRIIKISALLLFVTVFFASCLEDADDEVTYYSDAAIISFSVTNFNTYHTTTASNGGDSTYMVKEDGMKYKFYIDQTKNEIYNPDSLPVGTDAKHVICAIGTARGGNLYIKSATSDTLSAVYQADSLDFTTERVIKVVSLDGKYDRDYTVKVNVHKQLADDFIWKLMGKNDIFAKSEDMKMLARGKNLTAFVKTNGNTEVYTSSVEAASLWNKENVVFDADAYKNAIVSNGKYYIMSDDKIYSSDDASVWNEIATSEGIVSLAGCDRDHIYAMSDDGIMKSSDGCKTWTPDMVADSNAMLPVSDVNFVVSPIRTNTDMERISIIGNTNETSEKYASVWSRLVEYLPTTEIYKWNNIEQTDKEKFRLPQLKGLKVIPYAEGLYAVGGESLAGDRKAFDQIYFSKDGGITWLKDKRFKFPFTFTSDNSFAMTVDEEHNIWLLCSNSGQIWRGRLNGLAWESNNNKK